MWLALAVLAGGCGQDAAEAAADADAAPADGSAGDAATSDATPGPETCAGDGVPVEVDGARYCAHHDVARFTCPPDLPERHGIRGVALCSAAPLDDATAERVAEVAILTGRVLEARAITAFELPDAWRGAPGAPADQPLELAAATMTASPLSNWAGSDGDPILCERAFDRFEVEPEGDTLRITAWDRLRCGPDVVGVGAVWEESFPLALPPQAPGRRTLSARDGALVAPLVVDLAAACPARPAVAECFRGTWFADCGGAGAPGLWCADGLGRCLWADCPPEDYDFAFACGATPYCPTPHVAFGPDPWTRDRAMNLEVRVDPAQPSAPAAVACAAADELRGVPVLCSEPDAAIAVRRSPGPEVTDWALPSLVALQLFREGGISAERLLRVEIDPYPGSGPRARACVIAVSDGGADAPPICATAGRLTLDRLPVTLDDVAALTGALHAEFPDFVLCPTCETPFEMRGLVIDARF
jgi:hypothetical protein